MGKIKFMQFFAYLISSSLGILLAFWLTSSLIKKSVSQDSVPPPPGLPENVEPLVPPGEEEIPPPPPQTYQSLENAHTTSESPGEEEFPPPLPHSSPESTSTPTANDIESPPSGPSLNPSDPNQDPSLQQNEASTNNQENAKMVLSGDIDTLMAPYNYDTASRRDPFKEFRLDILANRTEEGVFVGPLRPLQRFDLDKIIPVAIIWDVESPKAMFVDPTNKVHVLGKDERIGRNNGYIATIREGEIVVIETVKRRGQLSFKTSILKVGSSK